MGETIYKICSEQAFAAATAKGRFDGSADDCRDGFIHFSARHQLAGTLAKHFAGQADLLLLTVDAASLGEALRWEASRGGDLFPHLYSPLPLAAVIAVEPLGLDGEGTHRLPPGVAG